MADESKNQIDALTSKYTEGLDTFSKDKPWNVILEFILFKRNLLPYTLQIIFILNVVVVWVVAVAGIFKKGPIWNSCSSYLESLGVSVGVFVFAPFVLHYALELVRVAWKFAVHVYEKVLVPIWNAIVVRFLANGLPQLFPFLFERIMKAIDVLIAKIDPLANALIGLIVAAFMTVVAVLKGIVWLPKNICQFIGKWTNKSSKEESAAEGK